MEKYRVKQLTGNMLNKNFFVDCDTLQEAVSMAIEHSKAYKCYMEIKRVKGNRSYFLFQVSPNSKERFIGEDVKR